MKIILLSGGSGKRLWPVSNNARSKQFVRVLPSPSGGAESMVQRVVRQIGETMPDCDVTIATGEAQLGVIKAQLGTGVDIVTEPERRDTFPAIALATSYLAMEKNCSDDEVVVVMPCDPFTDNGYFATIGRMAEAVGNNAADLVLMGICPTYASPKFGYVVPQKGEVGKPVMRVEGFTEKPSEDKAAKLIAEGALWNGGVFAFKLGYMKAITGRYMQATSFAEMRKRYGELPKISFDYEVAEKAKSIAVLPFSGVWRDLGTWNTLADELPGCCIGNAIVDNPECGSQVINQSGLPLLCIGTSNLIVAASPDGILVADKEHCERLKEFVDKLPQEPRYEEFGWGSRRVVDTSASAVTTHVCIQQGSSTGKIYSDEHSCVLTILSGNGNVEITGRGIITLSAGEVIKIVKGEAYEITTSTAMQLIEVRL